MEAVDLVDYLLAAEAVLGLPAEEVRHSVKIALAESALAAPFAGFGDVEFYPEPHVKAAVLCSRVARNHALPDGNKRVALYLLVEFLMRNGYRWVDPEGGQDEVARIIEQVAAGDVDEAAFAVWVRARMA